MLQPVNSVPHSRLRCHLSVVPLPRVYGNDTDEALMKRCSILSWPPVVDSFAQCDKQRRDKLLFPGVTVTSGTIYGMFTHSWL